jgi:hypothetical protein
VCSRTAAEVCSRRNRAWVRVRVRAKVRAKVRVRRKYGFVAELVSVVSFTVL